MRVLAAIAMVLLPTAAFGQEAARKLDRPVPSPVPGAWTVEWAASAEQAFTIDGDKAADLDRTDIQDEGEYSIGATFTGAFPRYADIAFTPLLTLSPNIFDKDEEEGAWSFQTKISRKLPLQQDIKVPDTFLPFISYKIGEAYPEFSTQDRSDDQTITAGMKLTNVIGILNGEKGTYYDLTLSYSEINASDDDKDRRGPKLSFEWARPYALEWRPSYWRALPLYVEASVEQRRYDTLQADGGGVAEADRYSIAAGLNLTRWARADLGFPDGTQLKVGFRYVSVDANRTELDREEWSFVPAITWER